MSHFQRFLMAIAICTACSCTGCASGTLFGGPEPLGSGVAELEPAECQHERSGQRQDDLPVGNVSQKPVFKLSLGFLVTKLTNWARSGPVAVPQNMKKSDQPVVSLSVTFPPVKGSWFGLEFLPDKTLDCAAVFRATASPSVSSLKPVVNLHRPVGVKIVVNGPTRQILDASCRDPKLIQVTHRQFRHFGLLASGRELEKAGNA